MAKSLSSREVIERLKADGWRLKRSKGSHHHFTHPWGGDRAAPEEGSRLRYVEEHLQAGRTGGIVRYIAKLSREGGTWLAQFPDAPGCQTEGSTQQKVWLAAADALEGWLETHLQEGLVPPRPRFRGRGVPVPVAPELALKLQLRWARSAAGLSQAALAQRVGVTQQQLARLESPDHETKLSTAQRVFAALGQSLDVSVHRVVTSPSSGRREVSRAAAPHRVKVGGTRLRPISGD